jgi:hypothetical protein
MEYNAMLCYVMMLFPQYPLDRRLGIIVDIQRDKRHVKIVDWCAPWKISSGVENFVLHMLHISEVGDFSKFPGGTIIRHY